MANKNDVVTVITYAGEFVGKFDSVSDNSVTLNDPRLVMPSERGLAFGSGVCLTGETHGDSVTFNNYLFYVPTDAEVEKAYRSATSGLVL